MDTLPLFNISPQETAPLQRQPSNADWVWACKAGEEHAELSRAVATYRKRFGIEPGAPRVVSGGMKQSELHFALPGAIV
jgi:hypothetical protein